MTDLGPLLAAVTDEWERGKTIAARAGMDSRTAGPRLAALERGGFVKSKGTPWDGPDRGVKLYRRGPNAPPLIVPPTAEQILDDGLRGKLLAIELHDATGDPFDAGFMECWREISAWLDAARPRP
jgi:hypothetical protein